MTWYAAHAILYFKLKHESQDSYPVWENVYLIEASTPDIALEKAQALGQEASGDSDGSLTLDEKPAEIIFTGIRKLITVSHVNADDTLSSGDEITYSEFAVNSLEDINGLVEGNSVDIEYLE